MHNERYSFAGNCYAGRDGYEPGRDSGATHKWEVDEVGVKWLVITRRAEIDGRSCSRVWRVPEASVRVHYGVIFDDEQPKPKKATKAE